MCNKRMEKRGTIIRNRVVGLSAKYVLKKNSRNSSKEERRERKNEDASLNFKSLHIHLYHSELQPSQLEENLFC